MSGRSDVPDLPPWFRELAAQAHRWRDELDHQLTPFRQAQLRFAEQAARHYETVIKPALEQAERIHALVRATWLESTPENWHALESEQLDVIDLVEETGICLMWAPRPEVIRALLAANPTDRYVLLTEFSSAILDDLDVAIFEARGVQVEGHADACEFAAEAGRRGPRRTFSCGPSLSGVRLRADPTCRPGLRATGGGV